MRAVYYEAYQGNIELRTVADPTPTADGVVIKVEATGVCRSDWHGWMGHDPDISLPHVPGHELAGTIAAVSRDVTRWQVGQRVTVPHELEILGSHGMQAHRYPDMMSLILAGKLQPTELIGHTSSLEEAPKALQEMDNFSGTGITVINLQNS